MFGPGDDLLRELLQTFQLEAAEHLQTLNMALLALEVRPDEARRKELVQESFRAAHSLKGAARAVGLDQIEQLAHGMENVLEKARDSKSHLEPQIYDGLYNILDGIGHLLEGKTVDVELLVNKLAASAQGQPAPAAEPPPLPSEAPAESVVPLPVEPVASLPAEPAVIPPPPEAIFVPPPTEPVVPVAPPPVERVAPPPEPRVVAAPPATSNGTPPDRSPKRKSEAPAGETAAAPEATAAPLGISSEETIRVAITKLDNLMAQVGELLVSKMNAEDRTVEMRAIRYQFAGWPKIWREIKTLLPNVSGDSSKRLSDILNRYQEQFQETTQEVSRFDQRLRQDTARLGVIASQLQDNVRHVRMVPFDTLVPVLQRAMRDAAHSECKQVAFNVVGGEVELDKKVLESLKDPLLHMLRNAVSHGIELPPKRESLGKPVEGKVTLSLQQRGGEVRISVKDDGRGFDLSKLRQAGVEKANYSLDERASQDEIIGLAFMPGLTTAENVTAISGRGIGLDVVRQHIEALQGRIQVESVPGKGATIHMFVPVTLTMTRGLLVQVGDERYVLPLLAVEKIVEPSASFMLEGRSMLTVDGVTLPLVSLASLLDRPSVGQDGATGLAVLMVVAEQRLALLVDDVLTEQELAVKPLGKPLHRVRNVAGAAVMGDGKPVVILNAADLVKSAKGVRKITIVQDQQSVQEKTTAHILVVDDSITTRTLEKNILETAGYEVTTATDGREALRRIKEQHIDLVVSDVQMPNMDGIALTRSIRDDVEFKDMPLILVTSLESREDRERGLVAGANAYIVKRGFDQAELLKTVEQLVFVEEV